MFSVFFSTNIVGSNLFTRCLNSYLKKPKPIFQFIEKKIVIEHNMDYPKR